ncbi:hypothetical protein [Rufibacter quisquiliarum]|uniref:Uncharacterized protein n=1 Tax=Rufibacter quisquiliarum TaxID=1549639 RepID=A0A839GHN3_9BACT|nr:hypothetical protein [Rufibacter quisquiliarum]MBA9078392.1 hypothetical protein [Rufibacter quisquiliarum]
MRDLYPIFGSAITFIRRKRDVNRMFRYGYRCDKRNCDGYTVVGKNKKMMVTDVNLKPSERLLLALENSFSNEGFVLNKSKNEFVRSFEFGQERVKVKFHNTMFLTGAYLSFTKTFLLLEKIYSIVFGTGKKYKSEWTLFSDLINIYLQTELVGKHNIEELYVDGAEDFESLYTGESISRAAEKLFSAYKETIEPIFLKTGTLADLDFIFNNQPNELCKLMGWYEKRPHLGLLVKWIINKSEVKELKKTYLNAYSEIRPELKDELDKLESFLVETDLNKIKY